MQDAHRLVRNWMAQAGMKCRLDAAGNLFGRFESTVPTTPRRILLGSHLDTVVDAGKYDGILGVILGIAVVEALRAEKVNLPWAVEVVAFSEEEGVRFSTPFLGSRALAGTFDPAHLDLVDPAGGSMKAALEEFGADPAAIPEARAPRGDIVAYVEPHIEQGPQLELAACPLGVVTAIQGQSRLSFDWSGPGGHAGTVPMNGRQDPLAAAARWIQAVERIGLATPGLVATVGRVVVQPNAPNCIPRRVTTSLDVRHHNDSVRVQAVEEIVAAANQFSRDSHTSLLVGYDHHHAAIDMDAHLTAQLESAIAACGGQPLRLASGAGHDAGILAPIAPIAMLFIRCRGGVSHSPDEAVLQEDVAAAISALVLFTRRLATDSPPS